MSQPPTQSTSQASSLASHMARYSVTLLSVSDEESADMVVRFLAHVFRERGPDEIRESLSHLPVMITDDVSLEAAQTLIKHLKARGGQVLLEPTNRSAPVRPTRGIEGSEERRGEPDTAYRMIRPGRRDPVGAQ